MIRKSLSSNPFKELFSILIAAIAVVGIGMFSLVPVASAQAPSLQPFVPGGLSKTNASLAWQTVLSRENIDPGMASATAQQSGASSFNASDYQPVGFSNGAPAGSTNSGISANGTIVPTSDDANCTSQSWMLVVRNASTGMKVYFCTNCGNMRLFNVVPKPVFHPFVKGTVVKYYATKTEQFKVCAKPNQVVVTVTATAQGLIRARTWGLVTGQVSINLAASFSHQLTIVVKAKCPAYKPAPTPVQVQTPTPPAPTITNTEENCVANLQGSWNSTAQVCTRTIVINAYCSNVEIVNDSGAIISANQVGNCNQTTPPPQTCPSGTTGTFPNCQTPPPPTCPLGTTGRYPNCQTPPPAHWTQISCTDGEEVSGGGSYLVDCAVSDDNGAQISLTANSNKSNGVTTSSVSGINCYSNGGSQTCPSGGTFEFRVSGINNGSTTLSSSFTAVASANGVTSTFNSDPFSVDPEAGGF